MTEAVLLGQAVTSRARRRAERGNVKENEERADIIRDM